MHLGGGALFGLFQNVEDVEHFAAERVGRGRASVSGHRRQRGLFGVVVGNRQKIALGVIAPLAAAAAASTPAALAVVVAFGRRIRGGFFRRRRGFGLVARFGRDSVVGRGVLGVAVRVVAFRVAGLGRRTVFLPSTPPPAPPALTMFGCFLGRFRPSGLGRRARARARGRGFVGFVFVGDQIFVLGFHMGRGR